MRPEAWPPRIGMGVLVNQGDAIFVETREGEVVETQRRIGGSNGGMGQVSNNEDCDRKQRKITCLGLGWGQTDIQVRADCWRGWESARECFLHGQMEGRIYAPES